MKDNDAIRTMEEALKVAEDTINRQKAEIAKLEKVEKYADETIKAQAAEIEELTTLCDMQDKNMLEQKAEIERLKKFIEKDQGLILKLAGVPVEEYNKKIRTEAIKEFAEKVETELDERVSENIRNRNPHWYIAKRIVRETAIEMTEESVNYESSKTEGERK